MENEADFDEVQLRYLNLLIKQGYKVKYKATFFGKEYIWLVTPSGQWFAERLPEIEEEDVLSDV